MWEGPGYYDKRSGVLLEASAESNRPTEENEFWVRNEGSYNAAMASRAAQLKITKEEIRENLMQAEADMKQAVEGTPFADWYNETSPEGYDEMWEEHYRKPLIESLYKRLNA